MRKFSAKLTLMLDPARHLPLQPFSWAPSETRLAIEEIVSDALTHFDEQWFWPAHPLDDVSNGHTGLYVGATGVIWALEHLRRIAATKAHIDFRPVLPRLIAANKAEFTSENCQEYAAHGSLLFGDMGTALLATRLAPAGTMADLVEKRTKANMA